MKKGLVVLIFLACLILWGSDSGAQTYGNWLVSNEPGESSYAATVNDSGAVLGQFCFSATGKCAWLLYMDAGCADGDDYPVLANSDTASASLKMYCGGQLKSGLYRYVFENSDMVDSLMKKGSLVGFAVAKRAGQFKVVRFSLNGAEPAIARMRSMAEKKGHVAHTRDLNL